jgi:glycosyl transferase family 25
VQIFVISLRSARARREHASHEMAAADVRFRFFDAIEGVSGPEHFVAYSSRLYWINARRAPMPGEIGCYASHLALWRHCVELGEPILVLEDDFHLSPGFAGRLHRLDALTREFGFLRLQSIHRRRQRFSLRPRRPVHKVREDAELSVYYLSAVPLCMLAYAISPSAAAALVEASGRLSAPVDKFIQRTWEHGVPLFGIAPALVSPAAVGADSTIGARPPRTRDLLLLIPRMLYKIGGRIRRNRFNGTQLRRLGLIR